MAATPAAWSGLELLATAVLVVDAAGVLRHANPAAETLFGRSRARLAGDTLARVFGTADRLIDAIGRAVAAQASYTEQLLELCVGDQPALHLACAITPLDTGGALLEFRHLDQQLRIAREERQSEQREANRELMRNLAHEIRNPLGGIRGAAQLLEAELAQPRLAEYTQVIIGEADRLQALVDRLLVPHRPPRRSRTNIHPLLVRIKGLVQAEFPQVAVICDFDISLPEFDADPEQLTQALLNVVRNAAQALATTREPEVRLVTRVARNVTLARTRHRLAVTIAVIDNGPGIAPALCERIFLPLVSGREGGHGVGLTIAQGLIAQHGGSIDCESAPGRTAFIIVLPIDTP
jgi:two-component system nitrogen regulation sensor histidine kinase GlnL